MREAAGLSLDLSLVNWAPSDEKKMVKGGGGGAESQRLSRMDDYLKRLEEERRKIQVFKRELPLCMILLDDAILRLKEEAKSMGLMGLKDRSSLEVEERRVDVTRDDACDKKKWMSSFQLWSSANSETTNFNSNRQKGNSDQEDDDRSTCENPNQACNYGNKGSGFVPYKVMVPKRKEEDREVVSKAPSGLSVNASISPLQQLGFLTSRGGDRSCHQLKPEGKGGHQHQQQPQIGCNKKQRRCWSPELHRRFVDALEKLGGPNVATPKQIRDLMQVDGLTNDEVKSHLQKYRLHLRKHPSPSAIPGNHRLWMGQDENMEHSDPNIMQVSSPQGPLNPCGTAKDISSTMSDAMQAEDDDKSESHSWNGPRQKP